jgi:hypothetical protein
VDARARSVERSGGPGIVGPVNDEGAAAEAAASRASAAWLLAPALAGAAVAIAIGVYGNEHDPTGESIFTLVFTKTIIMKAWFATAAIGLALFQLLSALHLFGKLPARGAAPPWLGTAHRVSGTIAFLISLPVAYHCLWALGFQDTDSRVLAHSLAGCFFYGAFVAKVIVVRSRRLPGYALPIAGGLLFSGLVTVWLTSALWFFRTSGFPSF